jgi:small subunit ribosomal protein S6
VREYETVFVLHPQLDDAGLEREIEAVKQTIVEGRGEVSGVHKWGRRKLAYQIRKLNEGFYTLIRFTGEPGVLRELDRKFKINESVLRHLTVHAVGEPMPPDFRARERRGGGDRPRGRGGRPGEPSAPGGERKAPPPAAGQESEPKPSKGSPPEEAPRADAAPSTTETTAE